MFLMFPFPVLQELDTDFCGWKLSIKMTFIICEPDVISRVTGMLNDSWHKNINNMVLCNCSDKKRVSLSSLHFSFNLPQLQHTFQIFCALLLSKTCGHATCFPAAN